MSVGISDVIGAAAGRACEAGSGQVSGQSAGRNGGREDQRGRGHVELSRSLTSNSHRFCGSERRKCPFRI